MKLNYKRTLLIGLAFLSISAFWQMYDNEVPRILKNTFGMGDTLTGAIMAGDNILALVLLPVFGAISDKINTPIGKRMPFILVGTACAFTFLMVLSYAIKTTNLILFVASLFNNMLVFKILLLIVTTFIIAYSKLMISLDNKESSSK